MSFGEKLAAALAAVDVTQAQLAAHLGVAKSTVTGWVKGTHGMRPEHMKRAAKLLKVDADLMTDWIRESMTDRLNDRLAKLDKASNRRR